MEISTYDVGDLVKVIAQIRDEDGLLVDPDGVTFKVKNPAGEVTEYVFGDDEEVEQLSSGNYSCSITIDSSGDWYYRWEASGSVVAAREWKFIVRKSQFS